MKEYTNKAGTFRVGQPIRAYHKGIYLLTKIEKRAGGDEPLLYYKKLANDDCVPLTTSGIAKGVERECDAAWCKPVTVEDLRKELVTVTKNYEATIKLIESL
jgi:hypothetical protein